MWLWRMLLKYKFLTFGNFCWRHHKKGSFLESRKNRAPGSPSSDWSVREGKTDRKSRKGREYRQREDVKRFTAGSTVNFYGLAITNSNPTVSCICDFFSFNAEQSKKQQQQKKICCVIIWKMCFSIINNRCFCIFNCQNRLHGKKIPSLRGHNHGAIVHF